MATPNELVAALERAKTALVITAGAVMILDEFLSIEGAPPSGGVYYARQEIAKIDAVLKDFYAE